MFDIDTCVDLCLYISWHLFLCQKALQTLIFKRERAKKALLQKLVWWKGGAKYIQNVWCQSQRLIHQRNYQKFHGIASQKLSCIDQKYEKWKPNEKLSIKCNHFGGGVIYVHFY